MKKSDFILIGLVIVIVVIASISSKGTIAQEEVKFPLELAGNVGLNQITYDDYKNMVDNNSAFIVIIERTGCGYCQMYMPIVEEVVKEKKVAINYIDTDTLTEKDFNELSSKNSYLKRNQWGTPTTLFMLGNRVIDSISGYVEKSTIEEFLEGRVVMGE